MDLECVCGLTANSFIFIYIAMAAFSIENSTKKAASSMEICSISHLFWRIQRMTGLISVVFWQAGKRQGGESEATD